MNRQEYRDLERNRMLELLDVKNATILTYEASLKEKDAEIAGLMAMRDDLKEALSVTDLAAKGLVSALKALYEETAEYIRINNLGDVHHNRSMQNARDVLAAYTSTQGQS